MNWGNRRKRAWYINYIKPISAFVAEGVADPKIINALDNLQATWIAGRKKIKPHKIILGAMSPEDWIRENLQKKGETIKAKNDSEVFIDTPVLVVLVVIQDNKNGGIYKNLAIVLCLYGFAFFLQVFANPIFGRHRSEYYLVGLYFFTTRDPRRLQVIESIDDLWIGYPLGNKSRNRLYIIYIPRTFTTIPPIHPQ